MKKLLICLLTLFAATAVPAQQTPYLWPVDGIKAGDGILYAPQSYIDGELNFGNLFITAPEGSVVVAPCDGIISQCGIIYTPTLTTSQHWGINGDPKSIDQMRAAIIAQGNLNFNPKYLKGSIAIRTSDGYTVWIDGLSSDKTFKTGQRIERGTPLGRVAYSYFKIPEPSISLAISKNTRPSDPMTPFGIKTTYIPATEIKPVTSLTKEQAAQDFTLYIDALKECFVGLYNVVTPEEFEEYVRQTLADIDARENDIPYRDFRNIIADAIVKVHDSHISLYPAQWKMEGSGRYNMPAIWFGFFSDTLRVSNATEQFRHLIGQQIASVNGISADSIRQIIVSKIGVYDAKTESYKQYALATPLGFSFFLTKPYVDEQCNFKVAFADGTEVNIPGIKRPVWIHNAAMFASLNHYQTGYNTKMLADSVAYLGIETFTLNQVQTEEIGTFLDSISAVPNLIIDVRNNGGGEDQVISKLYTYIAGKPMTLHGYSKVGSNTKYETFKHSLNQIHDSEIFPDYLPEEGKQGFYQRPDAGRVVKADSLINYKGRIYMLTNENSISAATLFPAMLVRNHRGVTVGRETRSAYHFMNAIKFVEVRLPSSQITVRLPLVETHFDSIVNERVPYGRGVLPDYPLPLSLDELMSGNDVMLDYTLSLIKNGEYLRGENPFAEADSKKPSLPVWIWILIAGVVLVAGILVVTTVRKSK